MKRYITIAIMLVLASSLSLADSPLILKGPRFVEGVKDTVPFKGFLRNNCPADGVYCNLMPVTEASLYVNKKGLLKVNITATYSNGCGREKFVVIPPQSGGRHYTIGVLGYENDVFQYCSLAQVVVHKKITLGRAKPGDSVSVNNKFIGMIK
jgi:hypothetical protein